MSIFCNNNEQGQLITVQGRGSSVLSHLLRKVKALFHRWSQWIHFHIHQLLCHRLYGRRNFTDLDQISQFRRVKTSFSSRKPPDSVRTLQIVFIFLKRNKRKNLLFQRWSRYWTGLRSDLVQINVKLWKCSTTPAGFHKNIKTAFALGKSHRI